MNQDLTVGKPSTVLWKLTVGKPSTVLWKFCLPLFGSIIFQQLYNIADSLVAGKFIGENALAAVGNSYEVTLIFLAFAFGVNIGCSVIVSQLFGARRHRELKTAVSTTLIAGGVLCLALMAGGMLLCSSLLHLIHTPENVMADSRLYLDIYILGLPFVFYYNIATGVFSALGDSKTPFIFLAISSTANIAVDILFVTAFRMGVAGVAWATFLCQGVSCVLAMAVMLRRLGKIHPHEKAPLFSWDLLGRIALIVAWATFLCQGVSCVLAMAVMLRRLGKIHPHEKAPLFSWDLLGRIALIAIPSTLQQSFISVGNIMIQGVINSFGSSVMAGYSASVKLNNLVISSMTTLGNGISNYTAQNLGAGKNQRVRDGFRAGLKLVWVICIPIVGLYFFAGRTMMSIFMDQPNGEAMTVGIEFLKILAPFYFIAAMKLVCDGILRGAGMMKQFMAATFTDLVLRVVGIEFLKILAPFYFIAAMKLVCDGILRGAGMMKQFMAATFTDLVLRVVLAYVFSLGMGMGSTGIWLAWPVGWCVGSVLSLLFYRRSIYTLPDPAALAYVFSLGMGMGSTGIWLAWPVGWCVGSVLSLLFYRRSIYTLPDPAAEK